MRVLRGSVATLAGWPDDGLAVAGACADVLAADRDRQLWAGRTSR